VNVSLQNFVRGVEAVNWASMNHAYGPATDVADLLKALAHDDHASEELRGKAAQKNQSVFEVVSYTLWGNVFHQGSVWGVSASVVPFLAQLALNEGVDLERRRFCVTYLHHLSAGYPTDSFPDRLTPESVLELQTEAARLRALGLTDEVINGDVFDSENSLIEEHLNSLGNVWSLNCYENVAAEVPSLAQVLETRDAALSSAWCALAASFPPTPSTVEALWRTAQDPLSFGQRGMALLALALLTPSEKVTHAASVLLDIDETLDTLYAAAAHVFSSGGGDTFSQVRLLSATPEELKRECSFAGTLDGLVGHVLERFPTSASDTVCTHLAQIMSSCRGFAKLKPLGSLLRVAARSGAFSSKQAFHRRVVEIIAEHADWGPYVNNNQQQVLAQSGLPTSQAELRLWLQRSA
jgi:hypothetical protein